MIANEAVPSFSGSIPEIYDKYLVPLIFEPYAIDLAQRVAGSAAHQCARARGGYRRSHATPGAWRLPGSVFIIATDLHQPMLDLAASVGTSRPVEWRQADALELPYDKASFDAVVCQFGVMFFSDRARAFAEARRVLRRGGVFIFNVWDRIEDNEFALLVTEALAGLFPADPPRFMARVPHGYYDIAHHPARSRRGWIRCRGAGLHPGGAQPCGVGAYPGRGFLPGHAAAERDRGT